MIDIDSWYNYVKLKTVVDTIGTLITIYQWDISIMLMKSAYEMC